MAELFEVSRPNVTMHVRNVFKEGELEEISASKEFLLTAADGKTYRTKHYNLDVIISVGYRVKSLRGTQFRQWATQVLRQYLVQGYALNEHRLHERAWIREQPRHRSLRYTASTIIPVTHEHLWF